MKNPWASILSFSYTENGKHKYYTNLFWFFLQRAFAKSWLVSSQIGSDENMKCFVQHAGIKFRVVLVNSTGLRPQTKTNLEGLKGITTDNTFRDQTSKHLSKSCRLLV